MKITFLKHHKENHSILTAFYSGLNTFSNVDQMFAFLSGRLIYTVDAINARIDAQENSITIFSDTEPSKPIAIIEEI